MDNRKDKVFAEKLISAVLGLESIVAEIGVSFKTVSAKRKSEGLDALDKESIAVSVDKAVTKMRDELAGVIAKSFRDEYYPREEKEKKEKVVEVTK
jgi:hypothetical protein